MFGLFLVRDWYYKIHIMSANQLRDRVIEDSKKSNYNWIAPAKELLSVCNKVGFDKNCAVDIKIAILNCYADLLNYGDVSKDIIYVYKAYNQLFGEEKAINARELFLRAYLRKTTEGSSIFPRHPGEAFHNFNEQWKSKIINDLSHKKNINFIQLMAPLKKEYDNLVKIEETKGTFKESDEKFWEELLNRRDEYKKIAEEGHYCFNESIECSTELVNNCSYSEEDDHQAKFNGKSKTIKHKNK